MVLDGCCIVQRPRIKKKIRRDMYLDYIKYMNCLVDW